MFIKKIFQDRVDETVHKQFIRFSRGKFDKRAIINVRKSSKIKVNTSFELANDLITFISSLAPKFKVHGILLSRKQIPEMQGKKKKGLFVYNIEKDMSSEELKNLASTAYLTLFDCSTENINLKIKKKLPRPGKGSKAKVNEKFCQLELDIRSWPKVKEEFLFDLPECKKARIEHSYEITEIILPKESEEKDFEKIRLEVKRKGKLIRKAIVDGKEIVREKEFVV